MQTREQAIEYLKSLNAPDLSEERILLAQFISTNPSVEQINLCAKLVINAREESKKDANTN